MRRLVLINKTKDSTFRIDPRLSKGYERYEDLPPLDGFPSGLEPGQQIVIEIKDAVEMLYRRSSANQSWLGDTLYRIELPPEQEEIFGKIWSST